MTALLKRVVERYEREGVLGVLTAMVFRTHPLTRALRKLGNEPSISIVQIGAFVFDPDNDPVYGFIQGLRASGHAHRDIKIILVEPVAEYCELLRKDYQGCPGIFIENVAIAEEAGVKELSRLGVDPREYGFPEWLAGIGSLKTERMTTLWEKYEKDEKLRAFYLKHCIVEKVHCITLQDLLDRHQLSQLDVLQIDTEGYDYDILKSIDFARIRPRFINYERVLLQEESACRAMLRNAGYRLRDYNQDTFCTRMN